jgi:hypothetical protein
MKKSFVIILIVSIALIQVRSDAVIGNGNVVLGVNDFGSRIVNYAGNVRGLPEIDPTGIDSIGLRNGNGWIGEVTGVERGHEGWGAGVKKDRTFTSMCGSNRNFGLGQRMTLKNFTGVNGSNRATSIVTCGGPNMTVSHAFQPSASLDLIMVKVTIENVGSTDFEDVQYRRLVDWNIDPTPFNETLTHIGVEQARSLVFSNTERNCRPLPSIPCIGSPNTTNISFRDIGPANQGSTFQFSFGKVKAGKSISFHLYYGVSAGISAVNKALLAVQAEVASLGQPSTLKPGLIPYIFILAFKDVGGGLIGYQP